MYTAGVLAELSGCGSDQHLLSPHDNLWEGVRWGCTLVCQLGMLCASPESRTGSNYYPYVLLSCEQLSKEKEGAR